MTIFNGFNNIMDTDILLDKNQVKIGKYYFDALAVNSELCFGQHVQSSKINERFTSDDFKFHQGFIDGSSRVHQGFVKSTKIHLIQHLTHCLIRKIKS